MDRSRHFPFQHSSLPSPFSHVRGYAVDRNGGREKVMIFATAALGYLMQGSGAGRN